VDQELKKSLAKRRCWGIDQAKVTSKSSNSEESSLLEGAE